MSQDIDNTKEAGSLHALLDELEGVRRREEWARTRAASGDGVKYAIASAKAEMVNEIMAMVRRRSSSDEMRDRHPSNSADNKKGN